METAVEGLSYIIPAHNEEDQIGKTVGRLRSVLSDLAIPYEIIVVNDGSRDGTASRLGDIEDIKVITHPINTGYGSALKSGILEARYPWIGIVDADGTYEIEKLPVLVERMRQGFDMVVGERKNVHMIDKPVKRLFRRLLVSFLNLLIYSKILDPNSGFRVFTRDLAMVFFPFLCNSFSFTTTITMFAQGEGYFVCYEPIEYSHRVGNSKVRHFRDTLRMIQLIVQGIAFANPVKMSLIFVVMLVLLVGGPALALALAGWGGVALGYMFVGGISILLVGMGVCTDIIRVSSNNFIDRHNTILTQKRTPD